MSETKTAAQAKDPNRPQALLRNPDPKRSMYAICYADDDRRMKYWTEKRGYEVVTKAYTPAGRLRRTQTAAYDAIRRQVEAELKEG
jgi:hypothetical protein